MLLLLLVVALATAFVLFLLVNHLYRRDVIDDFASKRILVTGCDSGFGRHVALELDRRGVDRVYAACYTAEGERSLRDEATSRVHTLRLDVTDVESIARAKRFIEDELQEGKGLWGVINNAGIAAGNLTHYATIDDFRRVMEVNFYGVINVTDAFRDLVIAARGRIVNVVSVFGRSNLFVNTYTCSKFALENYNDGLRRFLKDFGVHVAAIEPGYFHTNLVNVDDLLRDLDNGWSRLPQSQRDLYGEEFHQSVKKTFVALNTEPFLSNFNRISLVTDAMIHALLARRPKSRYVCGIDARFFYLPFSLLPDWIIDAIVPIFLRYHCVLQRRLRLLNGDKQ